MTDNSIKEFRNNFAKVYHSEVVPVLKSFEEERIKTKRRAMMVIVPVCLIIGLLLALFTGVGTSLQNTLQGLIFVFFFPFGVASLLYYCFKKPFELKIKRVVMPTLMKAFGDFSWQAASAVYDGEIRTSKLYTRFERISVDDNFIGSYKNVPIRISEAELTYETKDSDGKSETHTEFKGILISIKIPKKFTGMTVVKNKSYGTIRGLEEVKLEDVEFNKQFRVSTTDQVEARYLLTTAFMQRFKNIQKAFDSKRIECSFFDDKLLLAVSVSKDLFALGSLNKPMTDTTQFTTFLNEIISILEMIEELKLYQTTGL